MYTFEKKIPCHHQLMLASTYLSMLISARELFEPDVQLALSDFGLFGDLKKTPKVRHGFSIRHHPCDLWSDLGHAFIDLAPGSIPPKYVS